MIVDVLKQKLSCHSSVIFRGRVPGRADEFEYLRKSEIEVRPDVAGAHEVWALGLKHSRWGSARLSCSKNGMITTPALIEHAASLTREERDNALSGGWEVVLKTTTSRNNILSDRKHMLRFLNAITGDEGVAAIDCQSLRIWSPVALQEELAHDAELDVSQIFGVHVVCSDDASELVWLHTHGLAEIGRFDFDILKPCEQLFSTAADALRAVAYAILEGTVNRSSPRWTLAYPGGDVGFIDIDEFNRSAGPQLTALRPGGDDETHSRNRAVICEPKRGWIGKFAKKITPSQFLASPINDGTIFSFSKEATQIMEMRARNTYSVLRRISAQLEKFGLPVLVKLGYETDGGSVEHLWFTVDRFHDSEIEATLVNQPHDISKMKVGDRRCHSLDRMTEWTILTPKGSITPVNQSIARMLR